MLFPTLGPSSLLVVVAQPGERHANTAASVLEWFDGHRTYNIWFKRRRLEGMSTTAAQLKRQTSVLLLPQL